MKPDPFFVKIKAYFLCIKVAPKYGILLLLILKKCPKKFMGNL
jgi:hypothetical protein